jgi:membrane dipeptidase
VVGITGVGRFLSPDNDSSSGQIVRHINYVADIVGPGHVGLGLDWVVDVEVANRLFAAKPDIWPDENIDDPDTFAVPEQVADVAELLMKGGWSDTDVAAVLGENWLRVAESVWTASSDQSGS